jgi:hypothetical protein
MWQTIGRDGDEIVGEQPRATLDERGGHRRLVVMLGREEDECFAADAHGAAVKNAHAVELQADGGNAPKHVLPHAVEIGIRRSSPPNHPTIGGEVERPCVVEHEAKAVAGSVEGNATASLHIFAAEQRQLVRVDGGRYIDA